MAINLNKTKMNKINKSLLGNATNPHYIIFSGNYNFITEGTKFVEFKSFNSAKEANKYAKSINCFAVFATLMSYNLLLKYNK